MKNKVFIIMLCAVIIYFCIFAGIFMSRIGSGKSVTIQSDSNVPNQSASKISVININTATEEDFILYLDVDRSLAASIISYRNKYGEYVYISELKNVPDMTDEEYQRIKPYLTLSDG